MVGWQGSVPQLPRLFTTWPAMQPLTAVSSILAGLVMLLQGAHRFRLACLPLAALTLIVLSALFQYATGHSLGIDTLLYRNEVLAQMTDPFPGRMRLMNVIGLALFCLCAAFPRGQPRQYRWIARFATVGLVFPFATLCSYLLGAQGFEGMGGFVALSAPAALVQLLLFSGIIQGQRGRTWLHLLQQRGPGGRTARSLLPLILGWPLAVGILINLLKPTLGNSHQFLALALVSVMVFLAAMVLRFARRLDREVAARRKAETARRESEERYRLVVESASEGIVTIDSESNIVFANTAAAKIFGYSASEMEGAKLTMLIPERARSAYQASMAHYLETGERHGSWKGVELVGHHRDGHGIPLEVSYVEFFQGGQRFFTGIVRDISERKHAQAKLRQLNESLEKRVKLRTAELSRSNAALVQSNQELQRFAYIASHDLQTPLRSISGFAQILRQTYQGRLDGQADNWLSLIVENTFRLQTLIKELLEYSRIEAQTRPFEAVDFQGLFDEVVAALDKEILETGAQVRSTGLPTVRGDHVQLGQVLQNLIENAIKYHGPSPPLIQVSAERRGKEWLFSVRDNGIGIDRKHLERIFEPFKRLHTYQAYPGSGIGLAICRRVILRHGGRIWVESEPGKGCVFHFTLPLLIPGDQKTILPG